MFLTALWGQKVYKRNMPSEGGAAWDEANVFIFQYSPSKRNRLSYPKYSFKPVSYTHLYLHWNKFSKKIKYVYAKRNKNLLFYTHARALKRFLKSCYISKTPNTTEQRIPSDTTTLIEPLGYTVII